MPVPLFISITLFALLSSYPISGSPVSPQEGSNPTYTLTSTTSPFPTHALTRSVSLLSYSTQAESPSAYSTSPRSSSIPLTSQAFLQTNNQDLTQASHPSVTTSLEARAQIPTTSSPGPNIQDEETTLNQDHPQAMLSRTLLDARETTTPTVRQAPITLYGLYDAITNTRLAVPNAVGPGAGGLDSKKTGLAPLAEVFQAMTRQDPQLTGLPASLSITPMPPLGPLETQAPSSSDLSLMLAPLPTPTFSVSPPEFSTSSVASDPSIARIYTPNPGIGLVSIRPSVASSLLSPATHSATTPHVSSATREPSPTETNESSASPPIPVSKLVILGCIIGGILFFTICVLVLFGGAGLCGFCRHTRKRRGSKKGGKGIAGGLIYMTGDKTKRGSNALAHAMANGLAVGHGFAAPNSKLEHEYDRPKSDDNRFGGLISSLFSFRSRHNSRESSPLHKSPSMTSYFLGDKSRPISRASRSGRGNTSELEGWTNLTPALILGPVPVIQAHAQAHLEKRDRAREVVRGASGFSDKDKAKFGVLEEEREKTVQPGQQWNISGKANDKAETPQEIARQLLSTMKRGAKGSKRDKSRHKNMDSQDGVAKSKFSVCSSQYSESSLSVIELYSSCDEDSDDELGKVSGVDDTKTSGNSSNTGTFSGGVPQLARCASARVLSLPPLAGGVQWNLPNLDQETLANALRVGETSPESKQQPANSSPSRPPRPPRPATADSPTLSDSVYLACSEVAYVLKCAGGGLLSEGDATGQDQNPLQERGPADLKADVSSSSAYSSSNPTPNNSVVNTSPVNPISRMSVSTHTTSLRQNTSANPDGGGTNNVNTSVGSDNTSMGSQSVSTSAPIGGPGSSSRLAKRTSRLLTGLASLTNISTAPAVPGASSSASLTKQEKSRSSLLLNQSGEHDRSAERLALTRVPGATSASDRFGDAGVSTMSYASYAQGHGYGHDQPQDAQSSTQNGLNQTPKRRPPPQTPPHSRSDGTMSTEHARRSVQGYSSLLNHSNGYVQPHPYTYGPAAGYAYRPSRLSRIEGSPASITASAATGSVTAIGSIAATESSRASPTPSPGLLRSLSSTSASSSSTFESRHTDTRSETSKGQEDNTKAPRVSFNLSALQMQSDTKSSSSTDNRSGSQNASQNSESGKRGGSPRSLGKPQKKKRLPSYYHTDNEVDAGAESDIQEAVVRRIMKHRRSRSNSGWAYAGRGRK